MQLFSAGLFATTTVVSAKGLANDLSNYSSVKYDIQTSQCFVEGTLVLTKEGNKPIEEIQAGDLVYATDPETGGSGYKEVLRTFRKESDVLIHVFVNGEEIETTAVHPFWVENRWVSAKDLKEGDLLTLADGSAARISGVYGEKLDEAVVVYNFEVEEFHTYYVTEAGVLVHNANKVGGCGVTGNKSGLNSPKNKTSLWGQEKYVTENGLNTVKQHLSGDLADDFNDAMINRLETAYKNNTKIGGADLDFYAHEIYESNMMKNGMSYNNAHEAAKVYYNATEFNFYHSEVIKQNPKLFNNAWFEFWGIERN